MIEIKSNAFQKDIKFGRGKSPLIDEFQSGFLYLFDDFDRMTLES